MKPFLIVRVLTYNHEKYIKQCLDSMLMQEVNFSYQIIIGEDCSTDNTAIICKEYEARFPEIIKLFCNEKNDLNVNSSRNWQECRISGAKYIALLEGDDYWTDPYKLQKQVNFLEKNEECSMCFHRVEILKTNGELLEDFITKVPDDYQNIETFAEFGNYIHTPSVLFRAKLLPIPKSYHNSPIGDFSLYMHLAKFGKIGYISQNMAVYRYGVGIWSTQEHFVRNKKFTLALMILARDFENINSNVYKILVKRIESFLNIAWEHFSYEELISFMEIDRLSFLILKEKIDQLIAENRELNKATEKLGLEIKNKISYTTTKVLFFEIVRRLKFVTWKMLKFQ